MSTQAIGYVREIVARREAILARAPAAARRRIQGKPPVYRPCKAHYIEIDLRRPEARTVDSRIIVEAPATVPERNPFRPHVAKAGPPRAIWAILDAAAAAWQVPVDEIRGPRRHWKFAHPRFAAMLIIRERLGYSTPQIGKLFGGRDHSTAISALRRANELIKSDPDFGRRYEVALSALVCP